MVVSLRGGFNPLIHSGYGQTLLKEDEHVVNQAVKAIEEGINARYSVMLEYKDLVEDQKEAVVSGFRQIRNYYSTRDAGELVQIVELLPRLQIVLGGRIPSQPEDALELETLLIEHLTRLQTITEQIEPGFRDWERAHQELDRIHLQALEDNRRAQLTLTVWLQAYKKMASGVKNPAEWFSLLDLLRLGGKAVDKVL